MRIECCFRNAKACPLLEVTDPGNRYSTVLGNDCDITRDLPKYRVHKNGSYIEKSEIVDEWTSDSVAVLFGCSFTFEAG